MNTNTLASKPRHAFSRSGIGPSIVLSLATEQDREHIYGLRHAVYAHELGQHHPNGIGRLQDALDDSNLYMVAKIEKRIAGFISVTPPSPAGYSIEKHLPRHALPLVFDDHLFEIRL